jgi:hypothetical protein
MQPDEMQKAMERRYLLEIKIPNDPDYFEDVFHAIGGNDPRSLPVVERYFFDEGDWVEKGEEIVRYKENYGPARFSLIAPTSGIIGRFAGREDHESKNRDLNSLTGLPYGGTLVTIKLPEMHNITDEQCTNILLSEMRTVALNAKKQTHPQLLDYYRCNDHCGAYLCSDDYQTTHARLSRCLHLLVGVSPCPPGHSG